MRGWDRFEAWAYIILGLVVCFLAVMTVEEYL